VVPALLQYVLESEAKLSWLAQLEAQSKQGGQAGGQAGSSRGAVDKAAAPAPSELLARKRTGQWTLYLAVFLICFLCCNLMWCTGWGLAPAVALPARRAALLRARRAGGSCVWDRGEMYAARGRRGRFGKDADADARDGLARLGSLPF
jgi:hypothetical protein